MRGHFDETEVNVDPTKIDSHADTIVTGKKTQLVYKISLYLNEYECIEVAPISA